MPVRCLGLGGPAFLRRPSAGWTGADLELAKPIHQAIHPFALLSLSRHEDLVKLIHDGGQLLSENLIGLHKTPLFVKGHFLEVFSANGK